MDSRLRLLQRLSSQVKQTSNPELDCLREQVRAAVDLSQTMEPDQAQLDDLYGRILESLFQEHRILLFPLKKEIIGDAIRCADEALEHYGRIKAERPLTEAEKLQGKVYLNLMESARRLLRM